MTTLKRKFIKLAIALVAVMVLLILFSVNLANLVQAAEEPQVEMPVSINSIMVTFIDHAAHHLWDYGTMERKITDDEWRIVEYYAIQLAAAGPLLSLGGTGELDHDWSMSPKWRELAAAMTDAALDGMNAAHDHDQERLLAAGNTLTDSCEGCHELFKPELPTEGFTHMPDYDFLYHLFSDPR